MQQVFQDISLEQSKADIVDPDFVAQFNFYLVPVVLKWAKGTVSDSSDNVYGYTHTDGILMGEKIIEKNVL